MSVDHKRPLLAFIIVALICGMVIGHTLATAAVPTLWNRPVAIVQGIVFQAAPSEPTAGQVFSPVIAADPVTVVPAVDLRAATSHHGVATRARHTTTSSRVARGTHQVRSQGSGARWTSGDGKRHGHGKHHGHGQGHGRGHGHGRPAFVLSLRWR